MNIQNVYLTSRCVSDNVCQIPCCVQMVIRKFGIASESDQCGECDQYRNDMKILSDEAHSLALSKQMIEFTRKIGKIWFIRFCKDMEDGGFPAAIPRCDNPNGLRYKVSAFTAVCRGFCLTQYPTANPTIKLLITPVDCLESFCCTRTLSLCMDASNHLQSEETVYSTMVGTCEVNPNISGCPPGANVSTVPCVNTCDE